MLIVSPEVDLISFNDNGCIVRVSGIPSKKDIAKLNQQFYGTKEYWEQRETQLRLMQNMIQTVPTPKPIEIESIKLVPIIPDKKNRTLFKSIVLLFLLLLPNGLFFWSLLFKMLGSGI